MNKQQASNNKQTKTLPYFQITWTPLYESFASSIICYLILKDNILILYIKFDLIL